MAISTYVAVPTLAVGDKLTASRWNTIGTALGFLLNPPECIATMSGTQATTNNVWALVRLPAETVDTGPTWDGAMHDTVTNNSRVVATTAGRYMVHGLFTFSPNATGYRLMELRKNAGGSQVGGTGLFSTPMLNMSASYGTDLRNLLYETFVAGDYVEAFVAQTSGGNLNVQSGYLQLRLQGQ